MLGPTTKEVKIMTQFIPSTFYGIQNFLDNLNACNAQNECSYTPKADYQNGYGLFVMCRETLHSDDQNRFGSFDITVSSAGYDSDRYHLRYVFNLLEVSGEQGEASPWWTGVGGERPWLIPWKE